MRNLAWLSFAILLVGGCGSSSGKAPDGGHDSAVPTDGGGGVDFARPGDGSAPAACNPVDPMTDGQDCSKSACPSGTIGVTETSGCKCLMACTPGADTECACDRRCITLTSGDMGVVGGACLAGNGPGERCGADAQNKPFGNGICAQGLTCAGGVNGNAYCLWNCDQSATECPSQTVCVAITNNQQMQVGKACTYISTANGVATGQPCDTVSKICVTGDLCDTTCRVQCDGPGATCASGTCTVIKDSTKIVGYGCE